VGRLYIDEWEGTGYNVELAEWYHPLLDGKGVNKVDFLAVQYVSLKLTDADLVSHLVGGIPKNKPTLSSHPLPKPKKIKLLILAAILYSLKPSIQLTLVSGMSIAACGERLNL